MRKIAFVSQSIAGGGQERVTVNIVNHLVKSTDCEIILITGKIEENEYKLENNVKRRVLLKMNIVRDVFAVRKMLKGNTIDVAVSLGIYTNFLLCLCNFDMKTKMIISERNDPAHDRISKKSKFLRWLCYRNADGYVFQTEGAKAFYSKKIQSKGVIIPNPVKDDLPYKTNVNNKEIVAVGRLMPQKNYPMLIDAFNIVHKKHPEYILRIFGEGKLKEELEQLVRSKELNNTVIFEGFKNDVHNAIKDSSIYVLSSDFEGMPNSLMEAMAMGFPVVSTDCPCGGSAALIDNNVNGILVPVNDSNTMAEKICYLIENPQFCSRISEKAEKIRCSHSTINIIEKWCELLKV